MKLCKIDEQGYFVEDVIVDEYPTIIVDDEQVKNPLYIVVTPKGFYKPKYNFDLKKWEEGLTQTEIDATKKPDEEVYKDKVKELIREQYSVEQEIGLTNDCNMALMVGEPIPQDYVDYRNFVENCKDTAYLEVFGIERS